MIIGQNIKNTFLFPKIRKELGVIYLTSCECFLCLTFLNLVNVFTALYTLFQQEEKDEDNDHMTMDNIHIGLALHCKLS